MEEYNKELSKNKKNKVVIALLAVGLVLMGIVGSLAVVQMFDDDYEIDNNAAIESGEKLMDYTDMFEPIEEHSPEVRQEYIDKYGVDPFSAPDSPFANESYVSPPEEEEEEGIIDKILGFFGIGIASESDWLKRNVENKVVTFPDITVADNGDIYICHYHASTTDLDVVYYNGTWYNEVVDATANDETYCSIVADSTNQIHIVYFDDTSKDLYHANGTFGAWSFEVVDASATSLFGYTDLVIDDSDEMHVSYITRNAGNLLYANGTTGSWDDEVVDSSGDVANYTGIGIDSTGEIHISYYDSTNENLMHANGTAGSWSTETVTSTGNVGKYNSLDINSYDYIYISYFDNNPNNDLRVAFYNGTWYTETVDSSSVSIGQYNDIYADSNDMIHIVYYDLTNQNAKHVNGTFGNWDIESVDTAGSVGTWTRQFIDEYDTVHMTYFDASTSYLKYANRSFLTSGSYWNKEAAAFGADIDTPGTSITNTSTNELYICYYDSTDGDLEVAYYNNSGWFDEKIDTAGNVGGYCDIAADSTDEIHISYIDDTSKDLEYANGTFGNWDTHSAIDTATIDYETSIAINSTNGIHISYHNYVSGDLKHAAKTKDATAASFTTENVQTSNVVGRYSSIAVDSTDELHISYYDSTTDALNYANGTTGSWSTEQLDQGDSSSSTVYVISNEFNSNMEGWSSTEWSVTPGDGYAKLWQSHSGNSMSKTISMPQAGTWKVRVNEGAGSSSVKLYVDNVLRATVTDGPETKYISLAAGSRTLKVTGLIDSGWDYHYYSYAYYTGTTYNNVGQYTSIAVDSTDQIHVSYYDATDDVLRYANGSAGSWTKEDVDATANVGLYTGIALDINDSVQISYYDDTNNNLKYANGSYGSWDLETADNTGDVGEFTSIIIDQYNWTHISYYDDTNDVVKHASRGPGAGPAPAPTPFGPGFVNVSFTNPAYEQQDVDFDIVLNYSQSTYPTADVSFTYNGTVYNPTLISSVGDIHTWRQTLTMADVLISDTVSMRWNATGLAPLFNFTSTYYHTVVAFIIDNCSTNTLNILNVTHWDELNNASIDAVLEIVFEVLEIDGVASSYNFSFFGPEAHFHEYCIVDNLTSSALVDVSMYYYDNAGIYAPRTYYMINAELIGTNPNVLLYSLNDSHSTVFKFQLLDDVSAAVQQGYLQVLRYYTSEHAYKLVEVSRTDDDGETIAHLELYNPYYIYVMLDRDGNLMYTSNPSRAYCAAAPCVITVIQETSETFQYPMQVYDGVTYSLTFNESGTNLVRYQYVDSTGLTNSSTLHVYKLEADGTDTTICNNTVYSPSATILCDLTNYSNVSGDYIGKIYVSRSPELFFDNIYISIQDAVVNFGLEGVFWGMYILLAVVLSAMWRPEPVIIAMDVALIMLKITGIVSISYFTVISLVLIGGIMLWKFRD